MMSPGDVSPDNHYCASCNQQLSGVAANGNVFQTLNHTCAARNQRFSPSRYPAGDREKPKAVRKKYAQRLFERLRRKP